MLDAFIIEELRRQERERQRREDDRRPRLELPLEMPRDPADTGRDRDRHDGGDDDDREDDRPPKGIVVIELEPRR